MGKKIVKEKKKTVKPKKDEGWKSDAKIDMISLSDAGRVPLILGKKRSDIEILRQMGMKVNEPKPESPQIKRLRLRRKKKP